jgi:peptide/nickel transport system permease protein
LFGIIYKRCLAAIPLLAVLSLVAFSIIKSLPGDPVDVMLGTAQRDIPPAVVIEMKKELGLDQPLPKQYLGWLRRIVTKGDFGRSYKDGRPVMQVIGERLPATAVLVISSLIISFTIGIIWGILLIWLRTAKASAFAENCVFALAVIFYSAPNFWVGMLLIAVLASAPQFDQLSLLGLHDPGTPQTLPDIVRHVILPAIVLSTRRAAKVALFVRASTLDELSKEYVLTARSKGLSKAAVILRHVARNSLLPVVSLFGLSLPALLGGSVLVETVFAWPGMGRLAVESTFARNYPIMLALILLYGFLVIISNLLADIIQTMLDPRLQSDEDDNTQSSLSTGAA